jgi:aryl-alcohol dehydrogenase-like predicted oxidoreductase
MPLPELALRFILSNRDVTTTIPGMRRVGHVAANMAAARGPLRSEVIARLRRHRWDRLPDDRP